MDVNNVANTEKHKIRGVASAGCNSPPQKKKS